MENLWTRERLALHIWIVATACATFLLICVGGLVTSHGAGLAVPDWPNSFGYNMFAFPVSRWIDGIFYEHTHRLVATIVGLLTAIFAGWLWSIETEGKAKWHGAIGAGILILLLGARQMPVFLTLAVMAVVGIGYTAYLYTHDGGKLRWLGMTALCAVVLQGVLGGLRVVWLTDQIGIFHAMLAQSFFVLLTILAVMTSRRFVLKEWTNYEPNLNLRNWSLAAAALIFLQLGLGATMRHEHIGLSIPDFPLAYGQVVPDTSPAAVEKINAERLSESRPPTTAFQIWVQMVHRFMAVIIFCTVCTIAWKARNASAPVILWTRLWAAMIFLQACLGAWTIWSNKAADIATAHVALGALSLVLGAQITFRLFCGCRSRDFVLPDASKNAFMERLA
jgi:cytochrome c oxidase assembly protein subunit 15